MSIRTHAASFAHLLGLGARAEDEDDDAKKSRRAAEDDDDDKKSRRAEEEDDEKDDEKGKKAKKATRADDDDEDDDAKKSRRAEEDNDDDDKSKRGKKAKKADDDDDMEEDDDDEKGKKAAVRRDRARISQIVAHGFNNGCARQAMVLAVDTDMSAKAAIASLNASLADGNRGSRGRFAERMSGESVVHVGADGGKGNPSGLSPVAAAIVAAGEKARGGK